jgi:hypothetical protein
VEIATIPTEDIRHSLPNSFGPSASTSNEETVAELCAISLHGVQEIGQLLRDSFRHASRKVFYGHVTVERGESVMQGLVALR